MCDWFCWYSVRCVTYCASIVSHVWLWLCWDSVTYVSHLSFDMCDFDHVAIHWFASVTHSSCVIPDGLRRLFCILSMQEIGGGLSLMERFILADTQLWKGQSQQGHCGKVSHYRVTVKRSVTTGALWKGQSLQVTGSLWKGQSLQGHCRKFSHYRGTVQGSVTTGALCKGQPLQGCS